MATISSMRVIRASSRNLRMLATVDEMSRPPLSGHNQIVYGQDANLKPKKTMDDPENRALTRMTGSSMVLNEFFCGLDAFGIWTGFPPLTMRSLPLEYCQRLSSVLAPDRLPVRQDFRHGQNWLCRYEGWTREDLDWPTRAQPCLNFTVYTARRASQAS